MIVISLVLITNFSCVSDTKKLNAKTFTVVKQIPKQQYIYSCEYAFKSDSINIYLSIIKNNHKQLEFDFNFSDDIKSYKIKSKADLILLEDSNGELYAPEGTFILDSATNEEYVCDSTYSYNSDNVNISFGFETNTKKRLSLVIYKSNIDFIKNMEYTLYRNK